MASAEEAKVAPFVPWRRKSGSWSLGAGLLAFRAAFVVAIFFCHVQAVDPRCIYYLQNDLFLWNQRYLCDFLVVPGGPVDWLGRLVLQACHFGWPGAAILAAIAGFVCVATSLYLERLLTSVRSAAADAFQCVDKSEPSPELPRRALIDELVWAVPLWVMLVVHSRYDYPLASSLGAALAMGAAAGYTRTRVKRPSARIAEFVGLCTALYYLAGNALYPFALCALIHEFFSRTSGWTARLGMIAGVAAVKLGVNTALSAFHPGLLYFHIPRRVFFENELSLGAATGVLFASFPLCALLVADRGARLGRAFRAGRGAPKSGGEAAGSLGDPEETVDRSLAGNGEPAPIAAQELGSRRHTPSFGTILLLAVAVGASQLSLRRGEWAVLRLHESADRQEWEQVLRLARRVPTHAYSQFVRHDVNHALYQMGRLPWEQFAYPQEPEPFLTTAGEDPYGLRRRRFSEFLMRLGRVNDAEFFVHEDFARRPSADSLRLMARIAMVKDRPDMARLFLNVLHDDLIHGVWARDILRQLQEDPALSRDAEIAVLRAGMVTDDDLQYSAPLPIATILTVTPPERMPAALRRDPPNRMAFEFLMARYLVMRDVETVVRLLPRAAAFNYPATPPLYEEAAMIFARVSREKLDTSGPEVTINGSRISRQTLSKVRQLDAATASGRSGPGEISRVAGELGLTYFRYYYRQDDGT